MYTRERATTGVSPYITHCPLVKLYIRREAMNLQEECHEK